MFGYKLIKISDYNKLKLELSRAKAKVAALLSDFGDDAPNYPDAKKIHITSLVKVLGVDAMVNTDLEWECIDVGDVRRVINHHPEITDAAYITHEMDCDDFSQALHGVFNQHSLSKYAFGVCSNDKHMFNFFVDRSYHIQCVEPQTGDIWTYDAERAKPMYQIKSWII